MLRYTSEDPFAKSRMAVSACNDQAGSKLGGGLVELHDGISAFSGHTLRGKHAVAQQPRDKIFNSRQCCQPIGFVLNNFNDNHVLGCAKHGQRIDDGSP